MAFASILYSLYTCLCIICVYDTYVYACLGAHLWLSAGACRLLYIFWRAEHSVRWQSSLTFFQRRSLVVHCYVQQARWPTSFQAFSFCCFPSQYRKAGMTDMYYNIGLYRCSGDLNTSLHTCIEHTHLTVSPAPYCYVHIGSSCSVLDMMLLPKIF